MRKLLFILLFLPCLAFGQYSLPPIKAPSVTITNTPAYSPSGNLVPNLSYLGLYMAPLASPAFTGVPTSSTATPGTNTTQLSTTAFVTSAVATETTRATTAEATKQNLVTLTTTGSGAATFNQSTGALNIPTLLTRSPSVIASNITMSLNTDYADYSTTSYTAAIPATAGFAADGSKIITVLQRNTGNVKITVPNGYTIYGASATSHSDGTGYVTLTQNTKVQLIPDQSANTYYLQVLSGTVTIF